MTTSRIRCLVTGGAGFIGSNVTEHLVSRGYPTIVVDNLSTGHERNLAHLDGKFEFVRGDLTDPTVCRRVVKDVEIVFHVAALPSVPRSMEHPWESHRHNANATLHLLLAAKDAGVRRFVYSSSSSVYGDTPVLPKVETMEVQPRSPYAAAKLAAEQYVLAFARAGLVEGVSLRYFNVFGPRQDPGSAYAAVIPAFMLAAIEGRPALLFGDGGQTRDFSYVDNVVEANLLAATVAADRVVGKAINVGTGRRTSLTDLIALIDRLSGGGLAIERRPARSGDVRDSLAGLDRARAALGYTPLVSLEDGLARTWEWITADAAAPARRVTRAG